METHIDALVSSIRRHPCGRCDPKGTKERCAQYSEDCLKLYIAEATDVYNDHIRPLELRLSAAEERAERLEQALRQACERLSLPNPSFPSLSTENRAERLELALKQACKRMEEIKSDLVKIQ